MSKTWKTSEASLSPEAQEVLRTESLNIHKQNRKLSPVHHEGANTIFLTNKKLSLDKRLAVNVRLSGCPPDNFSTIIGCPAHVLVVPGKGTTNILNAASCAEARIIDLP